MPVALLLETALKSVVVLSAASLAACLLRNRSAASRHIVWTVTCGALLLLPALAVWIPAAPLPYPAARIATAFTVDARGAAEPTAPSTVPASIPAVPHSPTPHQPDWLRMATLVWAAGALAGFLQMALSWRAVRRLRRTATRVNDEAPAALARDLGIARPVDVLQTPSGSMPMTAGLWRPAVLIPAEAALWDAGRRQMVLLHELAHVRRRDVGWQLLARIAVITYWWNPLAWFAWRQFVRERERAADDLVLTAGMHAPDYASHLLEIARAFHAPVLLDAGAIAIARRSELEGRLLSILKAGTNRADPSRWFAGAVIVAALAILAPLAAVRAQQEDPADVEAAIRAAAAQKNYQMLDDAAQAAQRRLKFDAAQKLLESSLAIRAEVAGKDSVEYGVGLLRLGNLARRRNEPDAAEAAFSQAAAVLSGKPQAAPALVGLGVSALMRKDYAKASDLFTQARTVDPEHAASATMWLAVVREHQQDLAEAEQLYRDAAAAADGDPDSATVLEVCAQFFQRTGRSEEAASLSTSAGALRKSTPIQPAVGAYRITDGITRPVLKSKVEPEYSEEARLAKYQGTAVLYVVIGSDGIPQNATIVRGLGLGLDEKAIAAVNQWRFQPGTKDGQPVPVLAQIEINWRLR